MLAKVFDGAKEGKAVKLFKSHRDGIADGEQRRDFIYVDGAVAVLRWCLDRPSVCGLFNVGTGAAQSFLPSSTRTRSWSSSSPATNSSLSLRPAPTTRTRRTNRGEDQRVTTCRQGG